MIYSYNNNTSGEANLTVNTSDCTKLIFNINGYNLSTDNIFDMIVLFFGYNNCKNFEVKITHTCYYFLNTNHNAYEKCLLLPITHSSSCSF